MGFARSEGNGFALRQIVRSSIDDHAGRAFQDDEQLMHVGVGMGSENFARGDNDARDLGEWWEFSLAEPDAFFRCRIVADWLFRRVLYAN